MDDKAPSTPQQLQKHDEPKLIRKRVRPTRTVTATHQKHQPNETSDYAVGYGKPPRANQFKAGRSGNPNGRPRKKGPQSVKAFVVDELMAPITITENGKKVKLPAFQVSLRRLSVEAAKGNISAIRLHAKLAKEFMISGHDEINLTPEQELLLQEVLDDE